jgi:eukaryotic-like serine/threonine-protein kinase
VTGRLIVRERDRQRKEFPLNDLITTIGRGQECDLVLDYTQISRLHARLDQTDGNCTLHDCDSTNGTYVNGLRLDGVHLLKSGEQIGVADISITYLDVSADGLRAALDHAQTLAGGDKAYRKLAIELVDDVLSVAQGLGITDLAERASAIKLEAQGLSGADLQTSIGMIASTVYFQRPNLRKLQAPDGTVTIFLTDIEDSTPLTDRLGDQRWMQLLRTHNAMIRKQVSAHGGFEVKSQGDGFMIVFKTPRDAVLAAIAIQRAFAAYNESDPEEIVRVRIGVHTGEAVRQGDDFYGKSVIIATRVITHALGGEILVSSVVKEALESSEEVVFGEGREIQLKGLPGTHVVYPVLVDPPDRTR